jgi:transcriptional regulator with XRE-family HTH domain
VGATGRASAGVADRKVGGVTESTPGNGPKRLAAELRQLRHEKGLTQEKLAERASMLVPGVSASVDTVRILESYHRARPLPARQPSGGRFVLEVVAEVLGVGIADLLSRCFDDEELGKSCFAWVVVWRQENASRFQDVLESRSLADFISSLPADSDELLRLPGLLQLTNAEAFAYIFALERSLPALEMAILGEPPVILLNREIVVSWATGMNLSPADFATFVSYVSSYQKFFRGLALRGRKRYKTVLIKQTLYQFFVSKTKDTACAILRDMIYLMDASPRFEIVILDLPDRPDELEIISAHPEIPSSLDSTVSLLIRQTSRSAETVEYSLVPMPPTFSGLQRDISKVDQYWSLALDQYRASAPAGFWPNPNRVTISLLEELLREFS